MTAKSLKIDSSSASYLFSLRVVPGAVVKCSHCLAHWRTGIDTMSANVITAMTLMKPGTSNAGHQYKGRSLTQREWRKLIDPELTLAPPDIAQLAEEIGQEKLIGWLEGLRRSIAFSKDAVWTASWSKSILASGAETLDDFNFTRFPLDQVTGIDVQKRGRGFMDIKLLDLAIMQVLTSQQRVTRSGKKIDDVENDNVIHFSIPDANHDEIVLFAERLRGHLRSKQHNPSADPIDLIKRLADLREAGILTEDEFQSQKLMLLGKIGSG